MAKSDTEYAVEFVRDKETFRVPATDAKNASALVDAYTYDRDNTDIKIVTRKVTEWAKES